MALVEFGDQAYVITPFTSDYDNILLSIALIKDPVEFSRFPNRGTVIARALDQSLSLFGAFDFLEAAGNLMVIFTDGEDTTVLTEGRRWTTSCRVLSSRRAVVFRADELRQGTGRPDSRQSLDGRRRENRREILRGQQRNRPAARHCRHRPRRGRRHPDQALHQPAAAVRVLCVHRRRAVECRGAQTWHSSPSQFP